MKQCHHATVSGTVLGLSCVPRMYCVSGFYHAAAEKEAHWQ